MNCELEDKVFSGDSQSFDALALEIFRFQYSYNKVYQDFVNMLGIRQPDVQKVNQIPFLPVQLFKTQPIRTTDFEPEVVFESSGTTLTGNSRHYVRSVAIYRRSFMEAFEHFYGPVTDWCIVGLLPAYLERQHSSLVMMVDHLIRESKHPGSGFYLYEHDQLITQLQKNEMAGQKTLLIGVTFALLDLAEQYQLELKHTTVMETGGMKGRRKELTRPDVHELLKAAWGLSSIHSEYGMTELLSQAYSKGDGIFHCPSWMKVLLREEDDPLSVKGDPSLSGKSFINGIVNVIDLANIYSCSFIATDDIGKLYGDGSFEVSGRMDSSDVRGCNLMVS